MTRLRFYLGTRKPDGSFVSPSEFGIVEGILIDRFGGFTRFEGHGAWVNGQATVEHEPSMVYEAVADLPSVETREIASLLKNVAGQESVLVTVEELHGEFV